MLRERRIAREGLRGNVFKYGNEGATARLAENCPVAHRKFAGGKHFPFEIPIANALFAKELSRRLAARGIAVNSLHPGATRGTGLNKNAGLPFRIAAAAAKPFMRSAPRGAATQALLAANPGVQGISGEYWSDCRIARGSPLLEDAELAKHLWEVSEDIVSRHTVRAAASLSRAA